MADLDKSVIDFDVKIDAVDISRLYDFFLDIKKYDNVPFVARKEYHSTVLVDYSEVKSLDNVSMENPMQTNSLLDVLNYIKERDPNNVKNWLILLSEGIFNCLAGTGEGEDLVIEENIIIKGVGNSRTSLVCDKITLEQGAGIEDCYIHRSVQKTNGFTTTVEMKEGSRLKRIIMDTSYDDWDIAGLVADIIRVVSNIDEVVIEDCRIYGFSFVDTNKIMGVNILVGGTLRLESTYISLFLDNGGESVMINNDGVLNYNRIKHQFSNMVGAVDFDSFLKGGGVYNNLEGDKLYLVSGSVFSNNSEGKKGEVRYDNNYIYFCVDDDSWVRVSKVESWDAQFKEEFMSGTEKVSETVKFDSLDNFDVESCEESCGESVKFDSLDNFDVESGEESLVDSHKV